MNLVGFIKGLLIQDSTDRTKQLSVEVDPSATTATKTILKSAQTVDRTVTLPDATDTLVGKATPDILTNKDIDSDTNTLSNIKNTDIKAGAAIDATKIHDGTVTNTEFAFLGGVTSDVQTQIDSKQTLSEKGVANGYASLDGSGFVPEAQIDPNLFANQTLSNLDSPTAINQSLLPDNAGTISLGSTSKPWANITSEAIVIGSFLTPKGNISADVAIPSGSSTSNFAIRGNLFSLSDVVCFTDSRDGADPTRSIFLETGNQTGTGDSGNIAIRTGTAGGTRGKITLQDGSEGTVGDIWRSLGINGEGNWETPDFANQSLSNLTNPTSINQSLVPQTQAIFDLGTNSKEYGKIFLRGNNTSNASVLSVKSNAGASVLEFRTSSTTTPSGLGASGIHIDSVSLTPVTISTKSSTNATSSGNISLESGNNTSTGDSGNITTRTGTAPSGTRGKIILQDGSEGTVGQVWTSQDVNGEGNWKDPANYEYLETIDSNLNNVTASPPVFGTWYQPATANGWTLDITPGTWDINLNGGVQAETSAGLAYVQVAIGTSSTPGSGLIAERSAMICGTDATIVNMSIDIKQHVVTVNTTLYINIQINDFGGGTAENLFLRNSLGGSSGVISARRVKPAT